MFEKIGQTAEDVATSVSRRNFLGRFGRGAAALATALGGALLLAGNAHAGSGQCCMAANYGGCKHGPCKKGGSDGWGSITVRCSDYPGFCP